jgi:hypothetical protein
LLLDWSHYQTYEEAMLEDLLGVEAAKVAYSNVSWEPYSVSPFRDSLILLAREYYQFFKASKDAITFPRRLGVLNC